MRLLLLKVHMYAGLLTVSHLAIYGAAGLFVTLQRTRPAPPVFSVMYVAFAADPSATDQQVAKAIYDKLRLPLTFPLEKQDLRRDAQQNLTLEYYTVNGVDRITLLDKEQRLKVERSHSSVLQFLNDLHTALPNDWRKPQLMRVWTYWNEFSAWCLAAFGLSGVLLWILGRGFRWAAGILALAIGAFAWMWWLLR